MDIIKKLQDPSLVAEFQKFFGVIKKDLSHQQCLEYSYADGVIENYDKITDGSNKCRMRKGAPKIKMNAPKESSQKLSSLFFDNHIGGTEGNMDEDNTDNTLSESDPEEADYIISNMFWYHVFFIATKAGDEIFYAVFFPFWIWNVDGAVLRRVVVIWMITMYIGQALKDILKIPRPACPPVVRLDTKWVLEYGLPSTHAMVGFSMPFSVLILSLNRYQIDWWWGFMIAVFWCVAVSSSRLYLGMHSVLDIIVGLFLISVLMAVLIPWIDSIDRLALTHPGSPLICFILTVAMIVCYPSTDRWTPARGDTAVIVGVGCGSLVGSWLNYQLGIIREPTLPPPYSIIWPTLNMAGLSFLRTCIGLVLIVAVRAVFKSLTFATICAALQVKPADYSAKVRNVSSGQRVLIELFYKFMTYVALGFTFTYTSPMVFRFMGIERPTFYTEI